MKDVSFYGLLHIDPRKLAQFNADMDTNDRFLAYVQNAIVSARSLKHFGHSYRLVTNAQKGVARRLATAGATDIDLVSHDFTWHVPQDVPFYSAHYKLELAELLAQGATDRRVAILDLDAVMIRPLTLDDDRLYVCDHGSRGVSAAMRRDLSQIADEALDDPSWIGGEFLLGRPEHYAKLVALIKRQWPYYVEHIGGFHLVSDETTLSAAVALMKKNGDPIAPAEVPGGLARHWSIRTGLPMPPLAEALRASILHLPADKKFLAREAAIPFDPAGFTKRYARYANLRKFDAAAKWLAAPLFGKPRQHMPR